VLAVAEGFVAIFKGAFVHSNMCRMSVLRRYPQMLKKVVKQGQCAVTEDDLAQLLERWSGFHSTFISSIMGKGWWTRSVSSVWPDIFACKIDLKLACLKGDSVTKPF
tara:strand:+ start:876 stop:1196 length:321 start_codon:yes stop_codon:yes gene_type:complete